MNIGIYGAAFLILFQKHLFENSVMTMEGNPHIFEYLRTNIKLVGEDPTAISKIEKGLRQLESRFGKYAESMTEVLRVHRQMNTEIENYKDTIASQELKIRHAQNQANKYKKLTTKLKRTNQLLKSKNKTCHHVHSPQEIPPKNESTGDFDSDNTETGDFQGTIEDMKQNG